MRSPVLYILASCLSACCILATVTIIYAVSQNPSDVKKELLEKMKLVARPSTVTDIHGHNLGQFVEEARYPVMLSQVPLLVRKAFLAAEDQDFYGHPGISIKSLVRSVLVNVSRDRLSQGGSTITQQLVRSHLLTQKKSYIRKIREIHLALKLETQMNKNQILEMWLNSIYFGNNAWGIEAASKHYFNKTSRSLTLAEGSLLAGVIQAPSRLAPHNNIKEALKRRDYVLRRMQANQWISRRQGFMTAKTVPAVFKDGRAIDAESRPWVTESARSELWRRFEMWGLPRSGVKIMTNIDHNWQTIAERLISKHLATYARQGMEAAFVAIDTGSGEIRTMVGGTDFSRSQFNRVTQMNRPYGSGLFPLVYAWASEAGVTTIGRAQSLGAAAIDSKFQDVDRVAASLGYGVLREKFIDAGVRVKSSLALEEMSGSPLTLAQGWRVLTGRPVRIGMPLIRTVTTAAGDVINIGDAESPKSPGIGEAPAFAVRRWLQISGMTQRSSELVRYRSEASWNAWSVAFSDKIIGVLWVGVEAKPPKNPNTFNQIKLSGERMLDEWLQATGQSLVPANEISRAPMGLSWHLLKTPDGRVNRVPFPTSF
jgi:hypothetical protein